MDELDSTVEKDEKGKMVLWCIWSLNVNGNVSLRAICTTRNLAKRYVDYLKNRDDIVRAWQEKTIADHLYGDTGFEMSNYGQSMNISNLRGAGG